MLTLRRLRSLMSTYGPLYDEGTPMSLRADVFLLGEFYNREQAKGARQRGREASYAEFWAKLARKKHRGWLN